MYSDGLLKLPLFTIQKNFKILLTVYSLSPHTSINFSYIQKSCSNRYSPVVAAELSLLHVTVLDSGFATLRFHKCALMVNNFIEFAHFCQYIFLDKMLNCQLQHHFCRKYQHTCLGIRKAF